MTLNAPTEFLVTLSGLPEKRQPEFMAAVQRVARAIAEGGIPNPEFEDAKYRINRGIEYAWEKLVSDPHFHAGRYSSQPMSVQELDWSVRPRGVHELKPAIKRVSTFIAKGQHIDNAAVRDMKRLLDELAPLVEMFDQVKPLILKRKAKTAEEREAEASYVPPMASKESEAKVRTALTRITEDNHAKLVDLLFNHYEGQVLEFMEKVKTFPNLRATSHMVSRCVNNEGTYARPKYELADDWRSTIVAQAKMDAETFRQQFITKNLRKLGAIVDAKGNLADVKIASSRIDLAGLTGDLKVEFEDGSSFLASNSIVFSTSIHGKPFARFPLTFHNVVMPDGSRMPRPSEERVNTIFAVAGAQESENESSPSMGMRG